MSAAEQQNPPALTPNMLSMRCRPCLLCLLFKQVPECTQRRAEQSTTGQPTSNKPDGHHASIHRSHKQCAPQGTNGLESFKPKTISYTTAADVWSAGLVTNDLGTGFRLLGNPKGSRQLLFNIFDMLGMPTTDVWPVVELMPGYKMFCSSAS